MNGRRRFYGLLPVLLLAVIAAPTARAAENVLTLVPDDAWGFAVVKNVGEVDGKIEKLGERLGRPVPSLLAMFRDKTGIGMGLDAAGDMLLIVVPPDGERNVPRLLMVVPVTDYQTFVEQFEGDTSDTIGVVEVAGEDVLVAHRSGYAVFTAMESKVLLDEFLEREAKLAPQIASLAEWLTENDVAAIVLPAGVKAAMDKAIEAIEQGRAMFQMMGANAEGQQAQQAQQVMEMMEVAGQLCTDLKSEVAVYAVGARADGEDNIFLSERVQATPDGQFAEWIKAFEPAEVNYLASLPAGPFVFAGGGAVPQKVMEALTRWSFEMMKSNPAMYGVELSDEDIEKLTEISLASMKSVRWMSFVMRPGEADESFYSTLSGVIGVEDASRYLAEYQKAIEAWVDIMKRAEVKPLMKMDVTEVEVAGARALKIGADMSGMIEAQPMPQTKQLLEQMMGKGGRLDAYIVAADERTIVLGYVSEEKVAGVVKNLEAGGANLSQDAEVAETAKLLPGDAQMVGYLSPRGAVAMANRFMTMMANGMGDQMPLVEIPDFPETPPLGFTAKVVAGGIEAKSVVPGKVLEALGEYIEQVEEMINNE